MKYSDHSYDISPTYANNPYTGKTELVQAGYHVQNRSIEVIIKNQNFNNFQDQSGNNIRLNYNVRFKGHFGGAWTEISSSLGGIYVTASNSLTQESGGVVSLVSPNAQYTVIDYGLSGNNGSDYYPVKIGGDLDHGQVDFQVEALSGYYTTIQTTPAPLGGRGEQNVFSGESSGWSATKIINLSSDSVNPSAQPFSLFGLGWENSAIMGLSVVVVVLVAATLFYRRRSVRQAKQL